MCQVPPTPPAKTELSSADKINQPELADNLVENPVRFTLLPSHYTRWSHTALPSLDVVHEWCDGERASSRRLEDPCGLLNRSLGCAQMTLRSRREALGVEQVRNLSLIHI